MRKKENGNLAEEIVKTGQLLALEEVEGVDSEELLLLQTTALCDLKEKVDRFVLGEKVGLLLRLEDLYRQGKISDVGYVCVKGQLQ